MDARYSFYRDIAEGYKAGEVDRLEKIKAAHGTQSMRDICGLLAENLDCNSVEDATDLSTYTSRFFTIQEFSSLLYEARPKNSCRWALPLLKECYEKCGIDEKNREILTRKGVYPYDYAIVIDLFQSVSTSTTFPKIDIITIPHNADFDISSISIVGHEVAHVLFQQHQEEFSFIVLDKVKNIILDEKGLNKESTITEAVRIEYIKRANLFFERACEHFCDLVGHRIFGVAFDLSLLRSFLTLPEPEKDPGGHPSPLHRMNLAYKRLSDAAQSCTSPDAKIALVKTITMLTQKCEQLAQVKISDDDLHCYQIALDLLETQNKPQINKTLLEQAWAKVCPELDGFRPPFETVSSDLPEPILPSEIISAASVYSYGGAYEKNSFYVNSELDDEEKHLTLRNILIKHACYAISLYDFVKSSSKKMREDTNLPTKLDRTLWRFRSRESGGSKAELIVTPSIAPGAQYSVNSIDLRLGSSFLINKPSRFTHISPHKVCKDPNESSTFKYGYFDREEIAVGCQFILHPHQFVLACTLEYVCLPHDYYAFVLGRSTWGRLGLNIATATTVQAGFKGCLTLELRNLGETPLPLTVGTRISQLSIVPVPEGTSTGHGYYASKNKYIAPVSAELPKIESDGDWDVLGNFIVD